MPVMDRAQQHHPRTEISLRGRLGGPTQRVGGAQPGAERAAKMKIVLAYSGGLDTSVLLKQFIDQGHQVVAMTLNLGESDMVAGEGSQDALEAVRQKALELGALDAVLIDARERFLEEYALKALAANALYEGVYPLSAALSRPLIADLLVETTTQYGADAVAHGCTGKGNDQGRIA